MVSFTTLTTSHAVDPLLQMMLALYAEDAATNGRQPTIQSCRETVEFLLDHPDRGLIILLTENEFVAGYAILIPYWSNEFAGTLLFIDELFVNPEFRGCGIATALLQSLKIAPPFDAVALALEVTAENTRAQKLYAAVGFAPRTNSVMTCPV